MELSYSPLHLLADVACEIREIERLLTKISVQRLSSKNQFRNPIAFVRKRKENPTSNADSEVSGLKKNMKRKLSYEFEAENQEIKKQKNSKNQSVLISKPNLKTPSISISGLKLKFHNVFQSCPNSSSVDNTIDVVSRRGILVDFLKNQSSWISKRKRSPRKKSASNGIWIGFEKSWKMNHKRERSNPPGEERNNGYQTELPMQFKIKIQELEGSQVKLVIEKKLHASDVSSNNSRFSIPENQIQNQFLKETEKCLLGEHEGNKQRLCGLNVLVLDPCLRMFNLQLKKWKMKRNIIYNLIHKWNDIRIENGLKEKDLVQLWSFRRHDQLCFALIKL